MTLTLNRDAAQAPLAVLALRDPQIHIADETAGDVFAREALLDSAFGPGRFEKTAQRLREGRLPAPGLALALKDGEELIGTVRQWSIAAGKAPALLLGPVAIAAAYRHRGLGRRLIAESLFRAFAAGHGAIILVGDAPYYEPFGFSRRHVERLVLPGPVDEARFLGLELKPGALAGATGLVRPTGAIDLGEFRAAA